MSSKVSNLRNGSNSKVLEKSRNEAVSSSDLRPRTALFLLALIFGVAGLFLAYVYSSFPEMEETENQHVKFPKDIDDAKRLGIVLSRYKDRYYPQVLCGVAVTYLFLQTFAIPGSIFLSIVSGYLFSFPVALILVFMFSDWSFILLSAQLSSWTAISSKIRTRSSSRVGYKS